MHYTTHKGHRQKQRRELVSERMHRRENARRVGPWQEERWIQLQTLIMAFFVTENVNAYLFSAALGCLMFTPISEGGVRNFSIARFARGLRFL